MTPFFFFLMPASLIQFSYLDNFSVGGPTRRFLSPDQYVQSVFLLSVFPLLNSQAVTGTVMRAAGPLALFLWFSPHEEQIYAVPVDGSVALGMSLRVLEGGKEFLIFRREKKKKKAIL